MVVVGLWWIRRLIAEAKRIWAGESDTQETRPHKQQHAQQPAKTRQENDGGDERQRWAEMGGEMGEVGGVRRGKDGGRGESEGGRERQEGR
jgi:hypothetical protein